MWLERLVILSFLLGALYVLYLASAFVPVAGHQAVLGPFPLVPCGFKIATGLPCITCYMTRAFALMARGRFLEAFLLQPMGALLFCLTLLSVPVLLVALCRPGSVWSLVSRWPWRRLVLILIVLAVASWGYTVARELAARSTHVEAR